MVPIRWEAVFERAKDCVPGRLLLWCPEYLSNMPLAVEEDAFVCPNAGRSVGIKSYTLENTYHFGLQNDTPTATREFALRPLIDVDIPASLMEQHPCKQAAQGTTLDGNRTLHCGSPHGAARTRSYVANLNACG